MKLALQIFSWVSIIMGGLAIFASIDGYGLVSGGYFILHGLVGLAYTWEK